MCWMCDNERRTYDDYLAHMHDLMDRHGWAIQGVKADRIRPPWAYTVGLTRLGRAELVVTGMPMRRAAGLLNAVAADALQAAPFVPGEQLLLPDDLSVEIVTLAHPEAHLNTAVALLGPQIRADQLVWADGRGRWPWEVGFRGSRGGQPVLGLRTAA